MRGCGARWLMASTLAVGATLAPAAASVLDDAKMFDWGQQTPVDFLDLLRRYAKLPEMLGTFAAVESSHTGWVKEAHLPALVALVDSKEPCAHVATPMATTLPELPSFVGQEALFMIQAFRDGTYPPRGLSTSEGFYSRRDEILTWWKARP